MVISGVRIDYYEWVRSVRAQPTRGEVSGRVLNLPVSVSSDRGRLKDLLGRREVAVAVSKG